jgi:tetratricopeptide (TPR) repeat protein
MLVACALLASGGSALAGDVGPTLVMPFDRAGDDSALYWLGEGAAILLADDLNALGASALTRPERVDAFDLLGLPVTASFSRATVIKVGELLGASDVVIGAVEIDEGSLTVRARRLDIEAGRLAADVEESGPLTELFAVFERVARRLEFPEGGGRGAAPLERVYPPVEAFENYVKGLVSETPTTEIRFLERALQLHPRYDRARLALWAVRSERGEHEAALADARAVPDDSPLARRARFSAALSLLDLGRLDEAFAAFKALDEAQPGAALANDLGVVQLRRRDTPRDGLPTYFFTKAADAEPGSVDYAFNAGYAYATAQDMTAALYWLREAVRRNTADADAHFVLGVALQATDNPVEAAREKALAGQLSARYADDSLRQATVVPPGLERVMRRLEMPRAARLDAQLIGTAEREQQELATFHLDRGRRFVEAEQDRAAIPELRRAIYLSPYLAEAHLLLGRVYLRAGRVREAIDSLKIAIWCQETAEARLALAEAYIQTEDVAAARAEVERALELAPASERAREMLARIGGRPDSRRLP